jgi:hypothetical protein
MLVCGTKVRVGRCTKRARRCVLRSRGATSPLKTRGTPSRAPTRSAGGCLGLRGGSVSCGVGACGSPWWWWHEERDTLRSARFWRRSPFWRLEVVGEARSFGTTPEVAMRAKGLEALARRMAGRRAPVRRARAASCRRVAARRTGAYRPPEVRLRRAAARRTGAYRPRAESVRRAGRPARGVTRASVRYLPKPESASPS